MKKVILLACSFVLVSTSILRGQEVKIKKGVLLLDNVEIATVDDVANNNGGKSTRFLDKDKVEIFSYEKQFYDKNYWETIHIPSYDKSSDIESKIAKTSFNRDKVVAEYVIVNLKFYQNGQWDRPAIKNYIDGHQEKIMDRFTNIAKQEAANATTAASLGISVKDNGEIYSFEKLMGTASYEKDPARGGYIFTFRNAAKVIKSVGKRTLDEQNYVFVMSSDQKEYLYDNPSFVFEMGRPADFSKYIFKVLNDQAGKGYWSSSDALTAE